MAKLSKKQRRLNEIYAEQAELREKVEKKVRQIEKLEEKIDQLDWDAMEIEMETE